MDVVVAGTTVTLADDEVVRIVRDHAGSPLAVALRAQLSAASLRRIDVRERLTEAQRSRMGLDPPENWTPEALLQRWKSNPAAQTYVADLETALVVRDFLAEKKTREFWLCLGDSEMVGIATVAGLPTGYPPLDGSIYKLGTSLAWTQLSEPVSDDPRAIAPFAGVGLAGLFAWRRQLRVGGQVGVVMGARLGLASSQQQPGVTSSTYPSIVQRTRAAIDAGWALKGVILVDGANDAFGALAWSWDPFFAAFPSAVPEIAGKPIFYNQLPTVRPAAWSLTNWNAVRTAKSAWQSPLRVMVTTPDDGPWLPNSGDLGVHASVTGMVTQSMIYDAATAAVA